jgi:hypothetical protein
LPAGCPCPRPRSNEIGSEARFRQGNSRLLPDRFDWQIRTPEQAGFDTAKLDAAIAFAIASENPATRDLAVDLATTFGREPFDTPIGPIKPRGGLNGIIGQVLAALK